MKNTFGSDLSLTIFGESHGRAIGAVLDGMAAGVPVDEAFLAACMDKRRARGDGLSTPRVEADAVQLLSGVMNGRTTGTAIALMIENTNTRSGDYAKTADLLRPGHADYTAYAKYHGFQDARGGGHFSGRVTAALVAGGAIVLSALHRAGIDITTHIAECAGIADTRFAQDDAAQLAAQVEALASKPPVRRATAWAGCWKPPSSACRQASVSPILTAWKARSHIWRSPSPPSRASSSAPASALPECAAPKQTMPSA